MAVRGLAQFDAARLAAGGYVALPRVDWKKGAPLKVQAVDLTFSWKGNRLLVARGKGKPLPVRAGKAASDLLTSKPVEVFVSPGLPIVVVGVLTNQADIPCTQLIPVRLPDGL